MKITKSQYRALQMLSRKDLSAIRKNPKLVLGAKQLLQACKKTIKKVHAIPRYASHKKRETAYKRIALVCQRAIDLVESG